MIESAIKALLGVSAILGVWLIVQALWARTSGAAPGEDALAGRLGCHGCGCQTTCKGQTKKPVE